MIACFKNLWWRLKYPWPRAAVEDIRPLRISVCPESRFAECEALYDRNIPHGVPANHRDHYCAALRGGAMLPLIVDDGDRVAGTFGVQYGSARGTYWLCYMLVAPDCHRQGVGTTMFFASLALLPADHPHLNLGISALPTAADFYYRLGFIQFGEEEHSSGQIHQLAALRVWPGTGQRCRNWLAKAGARLPDSAYEIPTATVPSANRDR